jgi:hypothetical protein
LLPNHTTPDGVQGLQSGQIAPGPGKLHDPGIAKIVPGVGEVLIIRLEAMIRQRLYGQPEISQRYIVLISQRNNDGVYTVIAFQIIAFGRQDRDDFLIQQLLDNKAHPGFKLVRHPVLVGAQRYESEGRFVQAKFTHQRSFARGANRQTSLGRIEDDTRSETAPGSHTLSPV